MFLNLNMITIEDLAISILNNNSKWTWQIWAGES